MVSKIESGDLLYVPREASVQFSRPITFRVIRVLNWVTYDRWIWLDGYQLNDKGEAISRRKIFVQKAGLRKLTEARIPQPRRRARSI